MLSNAARWPGPKAGVRWKALKHFWALIFLVLFASRQKVRNKKCEHRCFIA
jgi:hypothetical protein